MSYYKNNKYRGEGYDRFLHAAQIHNNKHQNKKCNKDEFVFLISYRHTQPSVVLCAKTTEPIPPSSRTRRPSAKAVPSHVRNNLCLLEFRLQLAFRQQSAQLPCWTKGCPEQAGRGHAPSETGTASTRLRKSPTAPHRESRRSKADREPDCRRSARNRDIASVRR